jgi:hypothetical protein
MQIIYVAIEIFVKQLADWSFTATRLNTHNYQINQAQNCPDYLCSYWHFCKIIIRWISHHYQIKSGTISRLNQAQLKHVFKAITRFISHS